MKKTTRKETTSYRICPICGAHLDAGEQCDCEREEEIEFYPPTDEEDEFFRNFIGYSGKTVAIGMSDNLREEFGRDRRR